MATKPRTTPRRKRQQKLPLRVPPVAMAMPWATPAAPVVSYVCPVCLKRRIVTLEEAARLTRLKHVPLDELACGEACRAQWLQTLNRAIVNTGQWYVLRDPDWVWELNQGVVAEVLAAVLQEATRPLPTSV